MSAPDRLPAPAVAALPYAWTAPAHASAGVERIALSVPGPDGVTTSNRRCEEPPHRSRSADPK